jgi:hypothetical protein
MSEDRRHLILNSESIALLLCEGEADKQFFIHLQAQRGSFPGIQIEATNGRDGLFDALNGLKTQLPQIRYLKAILIAFDSANDPALTFGSVCKVLSRTGFSVPASIGTMSAKPSDYPAIQISTVPDDKMPGGLESLCINYMELKNAWLKNCIDSFFICGSTSVKKWSPEKYDKARYGAGLAVLNEDAPNQALTWAFSTRGGNPPFIPVSASSFSNIEGRVIQFYAAALAL